MRFIYSPFLQKLAAERAETSGALWWRERVEQAQQEHTPGEETAVTHNAPRASPNHEFCD